MPDLLRRLRLIIDDGVASKSRKKVRVTVPRFSLKPEVLVLKPELEAMGIRAAFLRTEADFTGISDDVLWVDNVYHRATIDFDEKGTVATATSGVVFRTTSAGGLAFKAERPFLYLIRDLKTGIILFMGRVVDPSRSV